MLDVELYGGRRGLLEHVRARMRYALGGYRDFRNIEWSGVDRLVFVCKGNICRSPYAEAKARSLGVSVISYGLEAKEGSSADPDASRNALLRGVDLSLHRSARIEPCHIAADDLVVVFEPAHLAEVRRRCADRAPVVLLGIWARPVRPHIQDPFGRSDRYFQECFSVIDSSVMRLVKRHTSTGAPSSGSHAAQVPCEGGARKNSCDRTPA